MKVSKAGYLSQLLEELTSEQIFPLSVVVLHDSAEVLGPQELVEIVIQRLMRPFDTTFHLQLAGVEQNRFDTAQVMFEISQSSLIGSSFDLFLTSFLMFFVIFIIKHYVFDFNFSFLLDVFQL